MSLWEDRADEFTDKRLPEETNDEPDHEANELLDSYTVEVRASLGRARGLGKVDEPSRRFRASPSHAPVGGPGRPVAGVGVAERLMMGRPG